ncbi:hypothetical protein [Glaciibacter psychrotolerans]|uniref:Large-conductance mechanosensitive channel n=1 Tax=Glaciibacter psychrotolerans TaxID=670054 RepID=A0A7Z0J6L9_9MICO|nr:hypothetical protein [Leifsonia psychrotolerans]NYJ20074.1 large-conductance mechanosensitive channel [Leifsonia psychrotolerans]
MKPETPLPTPAAEPTSIPIFRRILIYGSVLSLAIAVVGAIVGGLVAGGTGVVSALVGTAMAVVFMGITAASLLLANKFAGSEAAIGAFFGIVMGGWLLKFVVFLVLVVLLKGQPWVDPTVLFLSIIAGVVGSLVVDVVVIMKSRMTYTSDVTLPPAPHDD